MIDMRVVYEGEKITESGIYRMAMHWYHSDCCAGPSVSSTGLRTIENECPAEFWAFSHLNPNAYPSDDHKQHFAFGRAAHCLLVGGETFQSHFAVRPAKWKDWRTKDAQAWRDQVIEGGRVPLTEADVTHITNMSRELERHPLAQTLVEGLIEASLIWQDEETGIWCKARPDVLPMSGVISDFKTIGRKADPRSCFRAITEHAYHQQLALIAEGYERIVGDRPENAVLLFQQVSAPYHVTPVEVSTEALAAGREQNRRALRTMARCLETGEWPGYVDGIPVYDLPEWLAKALDERRGGDEPSVADGLAEAGEDEKITEFTA